MYGHVASIVAGGSRCSQLHTRCSGSQHGWLLLCSADHDGLMDLPEVCLCIIGIIVLRALSILAMLEVAQGCLTVTSLLPHLHEMTVVFAGSP